MDTKGETITVGLINVPDEESIPGVSTVNLPAEYKWLIRLFAAYGNTGTQKCIGQWIYSQFKNQRTDHCRAIARAELCELSIDTHDALKRTSEYHENNLERWFTGPLDEPVSATLVIAEIKSLHTKALERAKPRFVIDEDEFFKYWKSADLDKHLAGLGLTKQSC